METHVLNASLIYLVRPWFQNSCPQLTNQLHKAEGFEEVLEKLIKEKSWPETPPVITGNMLPSWKPEQETFVVINWIFIDVGSLTTMLSSILQLLASTTLNTCVPAGKDVAGWFQLKTKFPVPPIALTNAEPYPSKQRASSTVEVTTISFGSVTSRESPLKQPK